MLSTHAAWSGSSESSASLSCVAWVAAKAGVAPLNSGPLRSRSLCVLSAGGVSGEGASGAPEEAEAPTRRPMAYAYEPSRVNLVLGRDGGVGWARVCEGLNLLQGRIMISGLGNTEARRKAEPPRGVE